MNNSNPSSPRPRILTNMAYWQSPAWTTRTSSIYPVTGDGDPDFLPWWKEAWHLFTRSRDYDVILTMGIRESFAYALLCRLSGRAPRQIMCEVFIDQPQPHRLAWRIKTALYRWLARDVIGMITNSTAEIETNARRFRLPAARFRYVPLSSTIDHPEYDPRPDGYLLCAGRTLRDYDTLTRIIRASQQPWHVVAGRDDLRGNALAAHVTVHREIARRDYLDILRGARIVVLPLLDTERSTGQVVLLEAMSYGKPVITTRSPGTIDLVRDGENGFLVAPGDDVGALKIIDELFNDPARCERIGRQALTDIETYHSHAMHTKLRIAAIEELWRAAAILNP